MRRAWGNMVLGRAAKRDGRMVEKTSLRDQAGRLGRRHGLKCRPSNYLVRESLWQDEGCVCSVSAGPGGTRRGRSDPLDGGAVQSADASCWHVLRADGL